MDKVSSAVRSRMMAAVGSRDTAPEIAVRKALFANGFRYRLHRKDLPGKPDIVLPAYRMVVFVHGCFWHGHACPRGKQPSTNADFWSKKLQGNRARDQLHVNALNASGWHVAVVWECDLKPATVALLEQLKIKRQTRRRSLVKELSK